jgi:hypothetical protein
LSFEHWHRLDNGGITKCEGTIILVGEILWFISMRVDETKPERLRVMHIRDIRGRSSPIRWGIMSSDVPHPAQEPASCKIVLLKIRPAIETTLEAFATEHVRYVEFAELDGLSSGLGNLVGRMLRIPRDCGQDSDASRTAFR